MTRRVPIAVVVATALLCLATMAPGLDYYNDSGSIDALARGDLSGFFAEQPLMGPLSVVLRAPFVRLVFHADLATVYWVGAIPCAGALALLTFALVRRMRARPRGDRLLVALLCLGSVTTVRALHWGHPEELLATALAVGGVVAAAGGRPVAAGLLVGAAFATKQWAVLAGLPALLALPAGRRAFVVTAAGAGAALMLPMLIGDPDRFWLVQRAAGSVDPMHLLNGRPLAPGAHVNPYDVWLPFASERPFDGQRLLFADAGLVGLAHPLVLLVGLALPLLAARRRAVLPPVRALQLLALVLLARCALDPMSLDYYHVPVVVSLAAAAALGGRRELEVALLATAGLSVAFAFPAGGVDQYERLAALRFGLYFATVAPLAWWLGRELLAPARGTVAPLRAPAVAG